VPYQYPILQRHRKYDIKKEFLPLIMILICHRKNNLKYQRKNIIHVALSVRIINLI